MKARVTWLMPLLNAMPYLPETLGSIEQQTYTNTYMMAWDAGSTDGTLEELKKWIPSRIPGRVESRPGTIGEALRQMLLETDTPLCARMDGDDLNLPDRLERQVDFLDANPDIALLGTQMSQIDGAGQAINQTAAPFPESHEKILLSLLCRNPFCHSGVLFRRQAVLDSGSYRDMPNLEDYDLWFRMAIKGYRFHNLPQPLVRRRVYEASITQRYLRSGRQRPLIDACVLENAPRLYGCSAESVSKLRQRTSPIGAIPIAAFMLKFARTHGQNPIDLLTDPSILDGCYHLINPNDYASRALLKAARVFARVVA